MNSLWPQLWRFPSNKGDLHAVVLELRIKHHVGYLSVVDSRVVFAAENNGCYRCLLGLWLSEHCWWWLAVACGGCSRVWLSGEYMEIILNEIMFEFTEVCMERIIVGVM